MTLLISGPLLISSALLPEFCTFEHAQHMGHRHEQACMDVCEVADEATTQTQ